MGFLERLRARRVAPVSEREPPMSEQDKTKTVPVSVLGGRETLEVVGESYRQDALWRLSGRPQGERVRCGITAVLVPEPTNPVDPNAISVQIDGEHVGYLARETAQAYLPGLKQAMSSRQACIGLRGVIVGGGEYPDGPGLLGVFLDHDPVDFGLEPASYESSWYSSLPEAERPAIAKLRELLGAESDPITRHFQFAELEARLYRARDLYESALAEYDEACVWHDAEMESICEAVMAKWREVPPLDTYRQMSIRQQKKHDWDACKWWAERGLTLYGRYNAPPDAVEDLIKRRNRAVTKLDAAAIPRQAANRTSVHNAAQQRKN